jgi:hypothetical protein
MINGLGVMTFGSRLSYGNSVLDSIEYSAKSELLTPNRMQSQETSNTNIAANFLNLLTVTHVPQLD